MRKKFTLGLGMMVLLAGCAQEEATPAESETPASEAESAPEEAAAAAAEYPSPPEPNYGPKKGSITFTDTDPGPTIGGTLTMGGAVDAEGNRVDDAAEGITTYMVHWGLEVGEPGTEDDAGNGDLGGDCMGFRDTGHVVMMAAADAGDTLSWEIPQGTEVPANAVYFVGHTVYDPLHNLNKCTQIPIVNVEDAGAP